MFIWFSKAFKNVYWIECIFLRCLVSVRLFAASRVEVDLEAGVGVDRK